MEPIAVTRKDEGQRLAALPALGHPLVQVACACFLGALFSYYDLLFRIAWSQHANDFGKFYFATRHWVEGRSLYASNVATRMLVHGEWMNFLNMNPPHFHLVVLPLTQVDLRTANIIWVAVNAVSAFLAVMLAFRELRVPVRLAKIMPAGAAALLSGALNAVAVTGQFTGLLMLPMTLAWREARRGNWMRCGVWLGGLIGLKPFLALFVPVFLLTRRWRALQGMAGAGVLAFGAGLAVFGWESHLEWIHALASVSWTWSNMNASILGWLARSFDVSPTFTPILFEPGIVRPLWLCGVVVVAVLTLFAARRSVAHEFAITLFGSLLISPLGWVYYVPLALAPCLELWSKRRPHLAVFGIALALTPLFVPSAFGLKGLAATTLGSIYFWSVAVLFAAVVLSPVSEATDVGTVI